MGVFGSPKYLCRECENEFDTATAGCDPEEIGSAMQKIGEKMANNDGVGKLIYDTVNEMFKAATQRAEKIKDGTYDFSLDKSVEVLEEEEIPEELRESEEDKALDQEEQERDKKTNKVIDWVTGIVFLCFFVWLVYKLIDRFF